MSSSSEFNLKKEKCLSCQYYSGCHGIRGGLIGNRIEYDATGVCSKRGTKYQEYTSATRWCSKWTRDSRIAQFINAQERKLAEQKEKQEEERYERELRRENERIEAEIRAERKRIEAERLALEEERKKLEYERWYSSLTPAEQKAEDKRRRAEEKRKKQEEEERRIRAEREAEERRIQFEKEKKEREAQRLLEEENAKKARRKKNIIIVCVVAAFVALSAFGIKSCTDKKAEEERIYNSNLIYEYSYSYGGYVISAGSLYECPSDFTIPSSYEGKKVVAIKEQGFTYQTGITKLTIPSTITYIGDGAFKGCTSINEVSLPFTGNSANDDKKFNVIFGGYDSYTKNIKTLTYTGKFVSERAFQNCSFETVTLTNVTYISNYGFDCTPIKTLNLPNCLETIGAFAFSGSKLESVNIPKGVKYMGAGVFYRSNSLKTITVSSDNTYFCAQNNKLMSADKKVLYTYPGGITNKNVLIPSTIEEIKADAFSANDYLEEVTFSNGLKTLGSYAFVGCENIKTVNIPTTITSIGSQIFDKNEGTINVNYEGTQYQWNKISFKTNQENSLNGALLKVSE